MPRPLKLKPEELTPFAAALLDWMWEQKPSWTRVQVVDALNLHGADISRTAVDSWFRSVYNTKAPPSLPTGAAVPAVMSLTGWTEDATKRLTGYKELPPPGERLFIMEQIARWPEFDAHDRHNVQAFLTDAYARYDALAKKRPPRGEKAQSVRQSAGTAHTAHTTQAADTETPTPLNHKQPRRALATSGK